MKNFSFLKGLFWVFGLVCIAVFYIITSNRVQTIIDVNKNLTDSLKVLQKNISALDSLLNNSNIKPSAISVKLDSSSFCKQDERKYKFKLNPSGGVVTGTGVSEAGKEYYFQPSGKEVKTGRTEFIYVYKKQTAKLIVNIRNCQGNVTPKISLDKKEYCFQDTNIYRFNIQPSECTLKGAGVFKKGKDYYFKPLDLKPGEIVFECEYNGVKTKYSVTVKYCRN
jgi:hypothetical protein